MNLSSMTERRCRFGKNNFDQGVLRQVAAVGSGSDSEEIVSANLSAGKQQKD